jgi:hypothetical protein
MGRDLYSKPTAGQELALLAQFDGAYQASPLTTVEQELWRLTDRHFPGFEPAYDSTPMCGYLQRCLPRPAPLFTLDFISGAILVFNYLQDLIERSDSESKAGWKRDLYWLARLSYCVSPWMHRVGDDESSEVSETLDRLFGPVGAVEVKRDDFPSYRIDPDSVNPG